MTSHIHTSKRIAVCLTVFLLLVAGTALGAQHPGDERRTAFTAVQNDSGSTGNGTGAETRVVFAPTVFRDIGGQVATEDAEVGVLGRASGVDEVLVTMIDRRGRIASEIVTVDDDDRFDEDVALRTIEGRDLSEGPIVAVVFSPGRDGVVGDGEITGFTRADLAALDESTRAKVREQIGNRTVRRTQQQVLDLFYEESINDSGSDDLALIDLFRYTDGRTTIAAAGARTVVNGTVTVTDSVRVGEPLVVRGTTNRKPDDTFIAVDVVDGPAPQAFDSAGTDEWRLDGVWSVEVDTTGVEPGTYVVEADDGDDSDRVTVTVRPAAADGTANGTATPTEATPMPDRGSSG
ncbi:hypothetical protein [Halorarius halobius]|uniref:hypothetical protein n=1 Tax=Halorarius halobius TaxID=2962671 RepID=UPI0020CBF32D|nr:hypothetical protein [Halorarius halobius]